MKYPLLWKVVAMVVSNACFTPALAGAAKPSAGKTYTVKSGDTFAKIARTHRIPLADLLKANRLSNPNHIELGQRVVIPGLGAAKTKSLPETAVAAKTGSQARPQTKRDVSAQSRGSVNTTVNITPPPPAADAEHYVVQSGDTLSRIQRRTGTSVNNLCRANGITENTVLRPGQKLLLSKGAALTKTRPKAQPEQRSEPVPGDAPAVNAQPGPVPVVEDAPPAAPSAATVATGTAPHRIEKGETFSSVGRLYGVTQSKLLAANPGVNPARLRIGQTLLIPGQPARPQAQPVVVRADGRILANRPDPLGAGSPEPEPSPAARTRTGYLVEEGETLTQIAQRFHTTESELRRLNRMGDSDNIYAGRYILVPFIRQAPSNSTLAQSNS